MNSLMWLHEEMGGGIGVLGVGDGGGTEILSIPLWQIVSMHVGVMVLIGGLHT